MKLDPILTKAARFARQGNYDAAIKTLEIEANRYYGSSTYYYLLGVSYLRSNIFGMALTYLRLAAEQKKARDPRALLGLAALYLNHGDTDKAVDLYLEVQAIDASNKIAKRALAIIKRHPSPDEISAWIDSGRLSTLFPPIPRADPARSTVVLGAASAAAGILLILGIVFQAGLLSRLPDGHARELPAGFEIHRGAAELPRQSGDAYHFALTASQVRENLEEARALFLAYRDEAARVRLNRVLESNALEPEKNMATLLLSYLEVPGFGTIHADDLFTYSQVAREPFLFRDTHVIWRGTARNLDRQPNATSFDLLVGDYDTRRILEGIARVDYNFAIPINPDFPVEILGRVIPVSGQMGFRIQGIAINQAGMLDRNR